MRPLGRFTGATAWTGVLLATAVASSPATAARPTLAYVIRQQTGATTTRLVVSALGSKIVDTTRGKRATHAGAIVRYANLTFFALDYRRRTYVRLGLRAALLASAREDRLAGRTRIEGSRVRAPRLRIARARHSRVIAGLRAVGYTVHRGRQFERIWFAADIAGPSGRAGAVFRRAARGDALLAVGRGRALLEDDVRLHGRWRARLRTLSIRREQTVAGDLAPPAGFHAEGASRPRTPKSVPSSMSYRGGLLLRHPDVFAVYWGRVFKDHPLFAPKANAALRGMISGPYHDPLGQYDVHGGRFLGSSTVDLGVQNVGCMNTASYTLAASFVAQATWLPNAPFYWWKHGGHDPLIVVYVPRSKVTCNSGAGRDSGWHAWIPQVSALPWPMSALVHPFMPFAIVKVTDASTGSVDNASALDDATDTAAHELVEAATDPTFGGWVDRGQKDGELSDVCGEGSTAPFGASTRVNGVLVATYWSNRDHGCVPESRPTVRIIKPAPGTTVVEGRSFDVEAVVDNPLGPNAMPGSAWTDNASSLNETNVGIKGTLRLEVVSSHFHTLTLTVTTTSGAKGSASVPVTVAGMTDLGLEITPNPARIDHAVQIRVRFKDLRIPGPAFLSCADVFVNPLPGRLACAHDGDVVDVPVSALDTGLHAVFASFPGNDMYEPNSVTTSLQLDPGKSSLVASPATGAPSSTTTLAAKLTASGKQTVAFAVDKNGNGSFGDVGEQVGSADTNSAGYALFSYAVDVPAGSYAWRASWDGNTRWLGSSAVSTLAVDANATTITTMDVSTIYLSKVWLYAWLWGAGNVPVAGKSIDFTVDQDGDDSNGFQAQEIASITTDSTGMARVYYFAAKVGFCGTRTYRYRAAFAGDGSYGGSSADGLITETNPYC